MPEVVDGVPLHPLIVHAVVVLLPLAAFGVITLALVPRWRSALGFTVLCVTVVGTTLVPVAKLSGQNLRESLGPAPLIERHAALGGTLVYFAVPLLVVAIALWWMGRKAKSASASSGTRGSSRRSATTVPVVISVIAVIVAVATIVQVVRIGHSGADAVWSGVVASAR